MKLPSFLGGTDEQRSTNLSDDKCVNLYPVTNNNGSVQGFYKVDGLKVEGTLAGVATGAYKSSNGRAFYVSGTTLYELTVPAGVYTSTSRGTVTAGTYDFSDNGIELICVNGTDGWLFTFSSNALKKLTVLTDTFTVQTATATDVDATLTKTAHGLVAGDTVILSTTGSLPTYLLPSTVYYVLANGLTADAFKVGLTLTGATCTISNGVNCTITSASHGYVAGSKVRFLTTGSLPTGLTVGTIYYVISAGITQDSFRISATLGGTAITTSSAGNGVHSFNPAITVIQTGMVGCTISIAGPVTITTTVDHNLSIGDEIRFKTTGALPTGLSIDTTYYVTTTYNCTFSYFNGYVNVTWTDPLIVNNTPVKFLTNGTLPYNINADTIYYVTNLTAGVSTLSKTLGGNVVAATQSYMGYRSFTYMTANKFSLVSLVADVYGTRLVTSGTQSGSHYYYNNDSVAYGIHNYTSGGYGFPNGCTTVSYMNGRFIACEPNTQNFYVSEVLDGKTWDAINVQTVDSNPDYVVNQAVSHNELIVFCEESGEVYYDSGSVPTPFVRNTSGIFEIGCAAKYSVANLDNTVYWLGKSSQGKGIVYKLAGYTPQRVSTYSIENEIQNMSDISDARAFSYQKDGHHYYVLTFPTGNKTFVFDINTQLWHERANYAGFISGQVTGLTLINSGYSVLPAITLTPQVVSATTSLITDAVWNGLNYFAIFNSGTSIIKSSDGVSWVATDPFASKSRQCISYNGIKLCALNVAFPASAETSSDGITWNEYVLPQVGGYTTGFYSMNWNNIKYANGKFVAICHSRFVYTPFPSTLMIAYSTNGETWYVATTPAGINTSNNMQHTKSCLSHNGTIWVLASGVCINNNYYATSTDGIEWTQRAFPTISGTRNNLSITTNGTQFLLISWDDTNSQMHSVVSTDGINWTDTIITLPLVTKTFNFALTCLNGVFYMVDNGSNNVYVSTDSINWAAYTISGSTSSWNVAINNGSTCSFLGVTSGSYFSSSSSIQSAYTGGTYTLTITGSNTTPATGTYTISSVTGQVTDLTLINVGSGYASNPYLTFLYGGINSASATSDIFTGGEDNNFYKWPPKYYLYLNNKHLITDETTSIQSIDSTTYKNSTNQIKYIRSFRAPESDMKYVRHNLLELEAETGVGSSSADVISMRWSNDNGNTWSAPITKQLGTAGDYARLIRWHRLGQTKGYPRIYEISGTSDTKIALLAAYLS